ncbi:MAG TPA: aldo/keto reductase [Rhizomicrobium sp.]|jgi:aryl-alcohol dehydrogenase-like predicted oxidoreductase|nr:aldo/keto reductase [Rhizomicrobium sp.]
MEKRKLGLSGIEVAPLCLGGNVFGWTADEAMSFQLLDAFLAAGFDFVDTADGYSNWAPGHEGGESETVIGKWMKARGTRARVIIATKLGMWKKTAGLKAANIISACEGSLKRLQTDYIDLYQAHRDDPDTPQDETLEAFGKLVKEGKVRAIGASNFDATRLESALKISQEGGFPRYQTLQPLYNLIDRDFENSLQPLCVDEEIGVFPYYTLAAGFLTGKYRNKADTEGKARGGRVETYLNDKNLALLDRMDKVAQAHNATMAEVAIAWVRDRPSIVAPLASATNLDQLQSLIRGAHLHLAVEDIAALN